MNYINTIKEKINLHSIMNVFININDLTPSELHDDDDKNLNTITNYKAKYDATILETYDVFNTIMLNYINHFISTVQIIDKQYYAFIFKNGLDMLSCVFGLIYYYTKNLHITKHYSEKAFFLYCEFVGKIGDNDHSFLKLNVKDALLFVYKKTIFEINNNQTRNFKLDDTEKNHIDFINFYINVTSNLYKLFIDVSIFMFPFDFKTTYTNDDILLKKDIFNRISILIKHMISEQVSLVQLNVFGKKINNLMNFTYEYINSINSTDNTLIRKEFIHEIKNSSNVSIDDTNVYLSLFDIISHCTKNL